MSRFSAMSENKRQRRPASRPMIRSLPFRRRGRKRRRQNGHPVPRSWKNCSRSPRKTLYR
jgi:hypothetical protein